MRGKMVISRLNTFVLCRYHFHSFEKCAGFSAKVHGKADSTFSARVNNPWQHRQLYRGATARRIGDNNDDLARGNIRETKRKLRFDAIGGNFLGFRQIIPDQHSGRQWFACAHHFRHMDRCSQNICNQWKRGLLLLRLQTFARSSCPVQIQWPSLIPDKRWRYRKKSIQTSKKHKFRPFNLEQLSFIACANTSPSSYYLSRCFELTNTLPLLWFGNERASFHIHS
jgi:hypothetical protein